MTGWDACHWTITDDLGGIGGTGFQPARRRQVENLRHRYGQFVHDSPLPPTKRMASDTRRFEDAEGRVGGDDPLQPEARARQQTPKFRLGALAPAEHDEHIEVHRL